MGQIQIEYHRRREEVTFESLDVGEVFELDRCIFIKTNHRDVQDSGENNVFNFTDNSPTYFLFGTAVTPRKATLVIE